MIADEVNLNFSRLLAAYASGDKVAAIVAVKLAWYFRVAVPDWALQAIAEGFEKWTAGEARTIDESLGVERPKGWRKPPPEHLLATLAWQVGSKMLKAGRVRDESFKEDLAASCSIGGMSIGKTVAYEMFLQMEREIARITKDGQKVKPEKIKKPGCIEK